MDIQIKRAYAKPEVNDGYRVLIDRIWPRGIKKEDLWLDNWDKNIAPSTELRKWFNHEPEKFAEFSKRYIDELKNSDATDILLNKTKQQSMLTLIYSAKDEQYNQAVVLKKYLESLLKR